MRIAFFTDVYRPTINGVVVSIDSFASELRSLGHEVMIICPSYPDTHDEPDVLRIPAMTFPTYKEYRLASPISPKIERHMKETVYDVIHIHSPFSVGLVGIFYAKRFRLPIVYSAHTDYANYRHYVHGASLVPQAVIDKVAAKFSNGVDLTIAPSKKIADSLVRYGTKKGVAILPTGIPRPIPGHRADFKQKYKLDRTVNFLYLGRVTKEKNLEFLFQAFAYALPNLPAKSRLVIAGDGPYIEQLREIAADLGVAKRVIFIGFVTGQVRADTFAAADIFCHVSYSETQGLTLMEASSYGLPLLVSDDTAYEGVAVAGKNAITVGADEQEYAQQMIMLATHRELREKLASGSRKVAQGFSIGEQTAQLVNLYEDLIGTKRMSVVDQMVKSD